MSANIAPSTYRATVAQTYIGEHGRYSELIEIETNASDLSECFGVPWEEYSDAEAADWNETVRAYHGALVKLAWETPEVRELVHADATADEDLDSQTARILSEIKAANGSAA